MERNRSVGLDGIGRRPSGAAILRSEKTRALSQAFFQEWAQRGYAGISLEAVARSAGVGKAALYRRWPDNAAMASALLPEVGLEITAIANQGSLHDDLRALLRAIRRTLRHPGIRRVLSDLVAETDRSPTLEEAIRPFQQARRERANRILDRAVARGEIAAGFDRELALDLLGAPLFWRMVVLRQRVTVAEVERLAIMIEGALRAGERKPTEAGVEAGVTKHNG